MSQESSEICGECKKPFSQLCAQTKQCHVHNQKCFSCASCSQQKDLKQNISVCGCCNKISPSQNMFYDYQCDTYFCPQQFQQIKIAEQIQLPCAKHTIELKQFIQYIDSFCYYCSRKMPKFKALQKQKKGKDNDNDNDQMLTLRICNICVKKFGKDFIQKTNQKLKIDLRPNQNQIMIQAGKMKILQNKQQGFSKRVNTNIIENKQIINAIDLKSTINIQGKETAFGKQLGRAFVQKLTIEDQDQQHKINMAFRVSLNAKQIFESQRMKKQIDQKDRIIDILKQDVLNLRQASNILETQGDQLNRIIRKQNERSNYIKTKLDEHFESCIHCYLQFDFEQHIPMQICLRQHILCKQCMQKYKQSNHLDCPKCHDQIIFEKVLPCRSTLLLMNCSKLLSKESRYHQSQKEVYNQKNQEKKEEKNKQEQVQSKQPIDKPIAKAESLEKKIRREFKIQEQEMKNKNGRKRIKKNPQYSLQQGQPIKIVPQLINNTQNKSKQKEKGIQKILDNISKKMPKISVQNVSKHLNVKK